MRGSLPYRYAQALVSLAQEAGELNRIKNEFTQLQEISRQSEAFISYLAQVIVPRTDRRSLLSKVLQGMSASDLMTRFAHLLLARERFAYFNEIARAYTELCDELAGIVRAKVSSAVALSEAVSRRLEKILTEKTGKTVKVAYQEIPHLIGGVVIELAGRVYDGSVRGDLKRAQDKILKE